MWLNKHKTTPKNQWRTFVLWAIGLFVMIWIILPAISHDRIDSLVRTHLLPEYTPMTEEEQSDWLTSLYGSETAKFATDPVMSAEKAIAEGLIDNTAEKLTRFFADVLLIIELLLAVLMLSLAIMAVRVSESRRQRYIALALTILPAVSIVAQLFDFLLT